MTTYEMDIDTTNATLDFYQVEKYNLSRLLGIYGSSRLGMLKDSVNVLGSAFTDTDSTNVTHTLGNKRYELSNHLGNVLSVISDKPIPHDNGGTVDYWMADIKTAQDYSPFGVILSGRNFSSDTTNYSHSFQGQLRDDEITEGHVNFTYRGYDPRLGRLNWATDPLKAKYPYYSPYIFSGNRVLDAIELEGAEPLFKDNKLNEAYFKVAGYIDIKYNQKITVYQRIGLPVYTIAFGDKQKLRGAGYGVKDGGNSVNTQFNPSKTNGTFATVYVGGATATSGNLVEYGVFNSATISGSSQLIKELEKSNDVFITADKLRKTKFGDIPDDIEIARTGSRKIYDPDASGLVSENFEAPGSLGEVAATVYVEYSVWQNDDARRAASHAGMEVTITNSKGDILAKGHGGEHLNFTLDAKEKFSVNVQFSGKDSKGGGANISVDVDYSKPK